MSGPSESSSCLILVTLQPNLQYVKIHILFGAGNYWAEFVCSRNRILQLCLLSAAQGKVIFYLWLIDLWINTSLVPIIPTLLLYSKTEAFHDSQKHGKANISLLRLWKASQVFQSVCFHWLWPKSGSVSAAFRILLWKEMRKISAELLSLVKSNQTQIWWECRTMPAMSMTPWVSQQKV